MCHCRLIISLVLTFLTATGAKAQESLHYFFRHINQSDGLLDNQVLSIVQDGKGFIWIATPNGLQRYDGSRFINYPEMLSDPVKGFAYNAEMSADAKNNQLWIVNNTDIEKMELGKNNFTVYDQEKLIKDPSFLFNSYRGVKNERWLMGCKGVYHYDSVTKQHVLCHLNILPENVHRTSFMATDSTGNSTWFAAGPQLYLFDKKSKTVYSSDFNPARHPLLQPSFYSAGGKLIRFLMIDSRQNIWVTTWGDRLYKYDAGSKKISGYFLPAIKSKEEGSTVSAARPLVNCILEDDNHSIWVGTENAGLLHYNRERDNFDYCIARGKNSESIQYNYKIFALFQDKEQNIWVGTDKGISIFNPYRQYFRSIRHEENNSLSISKSEIISFIQTTSGDMLLGTWGGGIGVYDTGFNFSKNIHFKGVHEKNFVWSFQQMDDRTVWIGCQHGWLLVYDRVTGSTRSQHPPEMEGSTIRCMEKDHKGNIWFGLHNGKIVKWDRTKNKFVPYGAGPRDSLKRTSYVFNIFIDRSQHCWVSTEAGFKEFDQEKMVYSNTWLPDKNNANSISGRTCQGIEEYDDSTLLIGTIFGGLNFFNKRTKTFSHWSTADGMPSNTIYAIKKDTAGYIWFTTDYGLYKFNPAERKFIPYTMEPGVINSSFLSNKFYPLQNGQWITFTVGEAISFSPCKTEHQDNRQPKTEITGFKVFDKPVFIDSLLFENKPVRLSYKENFFTIEFASLNFSSLQQTNYYYRLGGIDKDWVNGGRERFANYTDLQPGEYLFDVKAENGNSSGETTSFKIIVAPPFWRAMWFQLLCLVMVAGIIYAIVKWRITTFRNDEKRKLLFAKQMAEMEMKALRSQMNPHFIFNCINSIDSLIQRNDKYHATVYLNKFAKLIRNILDSSKQNAVTLVKDLDTLKLYIELEQLRHNNKFTAEIKIDDALLLDDFKVPPLIVQPFVENAILHGIRNRTDNNGKLCISVIKQNDHLKYIIEDNGVGRDMHKSQIQKEKLSYGIDMSYDRIKLFNNEEKASVQIIDLYDHDKPAGTKVEVLLKIQ